MSMLPSANRMRRSQDFTRTTRSAARVRRGTLVAHLDSGAAGDPMIGLVVGKAVGGSVVRHAVSRKLRAQLAERLAGLPPSSALVVRALPAAATATSAQLGADLDAALRRLIVTDSATADLVASARS